MKILILGGYGVFGGRLAELLADRPDLELLICGRNLEKAESFCLRRQGRASFRPVRLDRRDIAEGLGELRPDLVVDASGPFQDYGADPYHVVCACIAARIDYLDFADASDFVAGVSQFDQQAKDAGVFVLSGVSSLPALSAAVLREMAKDMEILAVEGGIAPSPHAGIGLNVMRAVIGSAGAPVKLLRDGKMAYGMALAESLRFTIAPPGRIPLRSIRFSLVDVPDLQVIPPEYPAMADIWMGAGPTPEFLHRLLNLLARARARFRLPSLAPLSRLFYLLLNAMKFGEHRGGMFLRARGLSAGRPVERSWHLLAEGDDGPYIPSIGSAAVIRKLLEGLRPPAGARSSIHALDLADYERLFEGRAIFSGFREEDSEKSLYRQILGSAFEALPPQVQKLHAGRDGDLWNGAAQVRRGKGLLAKTLCALIGLPREGEDVAVSVRFARSKEAERWTRDFAGRVFSSTQLCGSGRSRHLLIERFGPICVAFALVVDGGRLRLISRGWSFLGLPLPKALAPGGDSFESEEEGRFCFNVEIRAPLIGLIVAYKGRLAPAEAGFATENAAK